MQMFENLTNTTLANTTIPLTVRMMDFLIQPSLTGVQIFLFTLIVLIYAIHYEYIKIIVMGFLALTVLSLPFVHDLIKSTFDHTCQLMWQRNLDDYVEQLQHNISLAATNYSSSVMNWTEPFVQPLNPCLELTSYVNDVQSNVYDTVIHPDYQLIYASFLLVFNLFFLITICLEDEGMSNPQGYKGQQLNEYLDIDINIYGDGDVTLTPINSNCDHVSTFDTNVSNVSRNGSQDDSVEQFGTGTDNHQFCIQFNDRNAETGNGNIENDKQDDNNANDSHLRRSERLATKTHHDDNGYIGDDDGNDNNNDNE